MISIIMRRGGIIQRGNNGRKRGGGVGQKRTGYELPWQQQQQEGEGKQNKLLSISKVAEGVLGKTGLHEGGIHYPHNSSQIHFCSFLTYTSQFPPLSFLSVISPFTTLIDSTVCIHLPFSSIFPPVSILQNPTTFSPDPSLSNPSDSSTFWLQPFEFSTHLHGFYLQPSYPTPPLSLLNLTSSSPHSQTSNVGCFKFHFNLIRFMSLFVR